MRRPWFPDWTGETVVLVASGPSARDIPLASAQGKARFVAINDSWRLAPWADILFACDLAWWNKESGCPDFHGMKITAEARAKQKYPDLRLISCRKSTDRIITRIKGSVGWGGNSGFHCLNLAIQFGCSKILLVGYDMTIRHGRHWHEDHPRGMNNPTATNVGRWRETMDRAAKQIAPMGIKVINCSPISALRNYPKMSFAEALLV